MDKIDTKYSTCDSYCSTIGRKCTGAWDKLNNDCTVKSSKDCQHDFRHTPTNDAICECGAETGAVHILRQTYLKEATKNI